MIHKPIIKALFKHVLDTVLEHKEVNSIRYQMKIMDLHHSIMQFIATTPDAVIILQCDSPIYAFKISIDTYINKGAIKNLKEFKLVINDSFDSYDVYRKNIDQFIQIK